MLTLPRSGNAVAVQVAGSGGSIPRCRNGTVAILRSRPRLRIGSMGLLVGILLASAFAATTLQNGVSSSAALSTAGTVFCAVFVQATPFLCSG
jgi:hypothetical protein